MIKIALPMAVALASAIVTSAFAEDVPNGVYDCYGRMAATGYTPDRGAGVRSPSATGASTTASKFSVTAAGKYLSQGGATGSIKFDGATVTLVDGPYAGMKFHKATPAWTLRMLNPDGSEGAVMCPRNTTKDPMKPSAW